MIIRIGTMFMGEVEGVAGQSVQTKFFVLGVPLVPIGSFFFTSAGRGVEIPLHGKSVLAGYLRLGLGLAAVLVVLRLFVMSSWHRDASDYLAAAIVCAVFIASVAWLGRLGKEEKARRVVLLARTGFAANPSVLPNAMRIEIAGALRARLEQKELPLRADEWTAACASKAAGAQDSPYRHGADRFDAAAWGDAYAYARYAAVDDPAWRAALPALWSNVVA